MFAERLALDNVLDKRYANNYFDLTLGFYMINGLNKNKALWNV